MKSRHIPAQTSRHTVHTMAHILSDIEIRDVYNDEAAFGEIYMRVNKRSLWSQRSIGITRLSV